MGNLKNMSSIQVIIAPSNEGYMKTSLHWSCSIHSVFLISNYFISNQAEIWPKNKQLLSNCPASIYQIFKQFPASILKISMP